MADVFAEDRESFGFAGSQYIGSTEIFNHLKAVFEDHATAPCISKVECVHFLSSDIVTSQAIAGMIPTQPADINPKVHPHHTFIVLTMDRK